MRILDPSRVRGGDCLNNGKDVTYNILCIIYRPCREKNLALVSEDKKLSRKAEKLVSVKSLYEIA